MSQTGFQIQCWARASVSGNEPIQTSQVGSLVSGCFRKYSYYSPVDTQATCAASGYFNPVAYDIITGDVIEIYSAAENSFATYIATNSVGIDPSSSSSAVITLVALSGAQVATVTVTSAQILAGLYGTPVQIIPAPGANRVIVVKNATLAIKYGTTQYQNGGAVRFQYDSTIHGAGTNALATTIAAADINAATAGNFQLLIGVAQAWGLNTALGNKGIYLSCATGEFTAGDSSFLCTVEYRIAALA